MAKATASTQAASATMALSISSCWTSRPRPAPIETRRAISRSRAARTRRQEIRDVRARDEQHEPDDDREDPQRALEVDTAGSMARSRPDGQEGRRDVTRLQVPRLVLAEFLQTLTKKVREDRLEHRAGFLTRHAGAKASEHSEPLPSALGQRLGHRPSSWAPRRPFGCPARRR